MKAFSQSVKEYMSRNVEVVGLGATLTAILARLDERRISAVPVVDEQGVAVGVLSRSDLLHTGRVHAGAAKGSASLIIPDRVSAEMIKRPALVCAPSASLRDAARLMIEHRVHRLFVVEDGRPIGVISTLDLTRSVRDARVSMRLGDIMTSPIVTVDASQTLAQADERLDRAHVTGLVVTDEDWPIGVFTQREALQSRDLPRETLVDDVLDPSILCMRTSTQLHHAASQASVLDVRRVIACAKGDPVGIVSGLDFARVVAA